MTDEDLISALRGGDEDVTDYIIDKYKNLVRAKARPLFLAGADNDDLVQEGMLGLFKALRDYDPNAGASFKTFAKICIERQMYTAVEAAGRLKHSPLNFAISLYANTAEEEAGDAENSSYLIDRIDGSFAVSPEEELEKKDSFERLYKRINDNLSGLEKEVFELYMSGMSYTEIAGTLNKEHKTIDNALQRIKAKVKKAVPAEY